MKSILSFLLFILIFPSPSSGNSFLPTEIVRSNVGSLAWNPETSSLFYLQYSTREQDTAYLVDLSPMTNQENLLFFGELKGLNLHVQWSPKATKGVVLWRKSEKSEESLFSVFDRTKVIMTPPLEKETFLCWWGEDPLCGLIKNISGKEEITLLVQRKAPILEEVFTFPLDYEVFLLPCFVVGNTFYFRGGTSSNGWGNPWNALDLNQKTMRIAPEIPQGTVGVLRGPNPESVILEETDISADSVGRVRYWIFREGSKLTEIKMDEDHRLSIGIWFNQDNFLFLDLDRKSENPSYNLYLLTFSQKDTVLTMIGELPGIRGIQGLAIDPDLLTLWCSVESRQVAEHISIRAGGQYSQVDEILSVTLPPQLRSLVFKEDGSYWLYVIIGIAILCALTVFIFSKKAKRRLKTTESL